ncbi:MAG TPA: hypothetical protein VFS43_13165 [Polyangiaceae bacterium]|nr:hypothetical protein [Polyangiaceae bacterium]
MSQMRASSGAMPGCASATRGSVPSRRALKIASPFLPSVSRRCASASQSITPTEKMSARRSTFAELTCSGAMYPTLPLTMPAFVTDTAPDAFAMPKSMSLTCPSYVMNTFCGLTSRCTMPSGEPSKSVSSCA